MKIAIIDQHPILRSGLNILLKQSFSDVTLLEDTDIQNFSEKYPHEIPDLVLLSAGQAPLFNTRKAISIARCRYPYAKLIINDEAPNLYCIGEYLSSGIFGYIAKQARITDLLECIQNVMDGKRSIFNLVFDNLNGFLPPKMKGRREVDARKTTISLAPRQKEIAGYLIQGKKTSEIAKILGCSSSTISTTKMIIMEKYKVDNVLMLKTLMEDQ